MGVRSARGRADRGDGADPQRLGAAGGLVPPPRRQGDHGPAGAVGGPARLLLQARQVRPAGLPDAGPPAAAASRGAAARRGTGPRGRDAPGDQAARQPGQAPQRDRGPARLLPGAARPGLARRLRRRPGALHAAAVPGRRLRRPARAAPARQDPADPVHLALLPRRLGRGARHPAARRRGRDPAAVGRRAQLPRPGRRHRRRGPPGPRALRRDPRPGQEDRRAAAPGRSGRHHDLSARRRHHQRRADPGPPRRPRPVPVPGRRPLLQRPGPLPDRLRRQRPPRATDQIRRRPAARGPVHGRQRRPPHRPAPSPPATTGSWCTRASTTTPRSATSPQPC